MWAEQGWGGQLDCGGAGGGSCLPEMSWQVSVMLSISTLWIDWVLKSFLQEKKNK